MKVPCTKNEWPKWQPTEKGIYIFFLSYFLHLVSFLSLNFLIKCLVRRAINKRKTPAYISEIYQAVMLILGFLGIITNALNANFLFALSIYRPLEIVVFAFRWVFLDTDELHSYKRSILGFLLSLVEIAIFFSILSRLTSCVETGADPLGIFISHMFGIVTFNKPEYLSQGQQCNVYALLELSLAAFLILIVIAYLIGLLSRKGKNQDRRLG